MGGLSYSPQMTQPSGLWKTWKAILDIKTCIYCRKLHGKIFAYDEQLRYNVPLHEKCRCIITLLQAILAGTATILGTEGADWYLMYTSKLPDYYIDKKTAKQHGWESYLGNLGFCLGSQLVEMCF